MKNIDKIVIFGTINIYIIFSKIKKNDHKHRNHIFQSIPLITMPIGSNLTRTHESTSDRIPPSIIQNYETFKTRTYQVLCH